MRISKRTQAAEKRHETGRRGDTVRLPSHMNRKKPVFVLVCLSVLLLAAAFVAFLLIYQEGEEARRNSQKLMDEYNRAVTQSHAAQLPPTPTPSATATPPTGTATAAVETGLPPGNGYEQPDKPDVDPKDAMISLPGYDVIGKLSIEKIGLELPVIAEMTKKALRVSVCYYDGALPGEKGNIVITGHNYANGAHFGKLDALKKGDAVTFDTPDGNEYRYEVYETLVVTPDNLKALDKYEGEYALTLLTCASSGNRRLLVRCRLKE